MQRQKHPERYSRNGFSTDSYRNDHQRGHYEPDRYNEQYARGMDRRNRHEEGYDRYGFDSGRYNNERRTYNDRNDWRYRPVRDNSGFEDEYEDVTEGYGRTAGNQNYNARYGQYGDRRYGSNGRGYNEWTGGRGDQFDRDDYNLDRRYNRRHEDRYDNNGYNSFDQYADRGNYNTSRNEGGGYGSTSNCYDGDGLSRYSHTDRNRRNDYAFFNDGSPDWQHSNRQRYSRKGFGSMSSEKRKAMALRTDRMSHN